MRDVDIVVRDARRQGWEVRPTRGGHLRFQKGTAVVHAPSTPSDWRSLRNLRALLRRYA